MDLNKKTWQWLMLIGLAFIWGSSFILMKLGLESYNNYQVAALRIFISFLFFLPFIIKHLKKLNKQNLKPLLIVGFIGNGIPAFLFTTAQTKVDSSVAGILNSLTPLFTLIVGILFYNSKSKGINIIGIIIGFLGACGLVIKDVNNIFSENNLYALLIALATFFYGYNINEVKKYLDELNGVAISALAFMFIGPPSGMYLLFSDFPSAFHSDPNGIHLLCIVTLSFFSSFIAVIGINILIKYTTTIFASSVTYIIPIFAILWGILFAAESLNWVQIICIGVVLVGVYLANQRDKTKIIFHETVREELSKNENPG